MILQVFLVVLKASGREVHSTTQLSEMHSYRALVIILEELAVFMVNHLQLT